MLKFQNTYSSLPENFYQKVVPSSAIVPKLIEFNSKLANELGLNLENASEQEIVDLFSGKKLVENSTPIAMVYAAHQFGHFVPQLGDGRAILLGEVLSPTGKRFDIQLKGSGPTGYSRRGDGLSSLGPVLREYIVSEAMYALNIPTTRALAAVTSGATVYREAPFPGGIFTRVAASHLRIGTFQYFAARNDTSSLKILADYAISRHYPEILNEESPYLTFLERVAQKQAQLIAKWMSVGFIHGVMNTDNMTISGETIDFGPCAFMDEFEFNRVYSFIDRNARYAYNNQIEIAQWNLTRLAECLIPLIHSEEVKAIEILDKKLAELPSLFENEWLNHMRKKMGLFNSEIEDKKLITDWLIYLQNEKLDFTNSFKSLSTFIVKDDNRPIILAWKKRLKLQGQSTEEVVSLLNSVNPVYIPRNHQIEKAISMGIQGDFSHFKKLNEVLKNPFQEQANCQDLKNPPQPHEIVQNTFCGT